MTSANIRDAAANQPADAEKQKQQSRNTRQGPHSCPWDREAGFNGTKINGITGIVHTVITHTSTKALIKCCSVYSLQAERGLDRDLDQERLKQTSLSE